MKKTRMLFLVLAVALIGITSPVSAAEESPSNYVLVKGGIYAPSLSFDLDNTGVNNRNHYDSKTGFAGEIAFGHYFLPMLALELGGGYFESKGSPGSNADGAKLKVVPLIASAKVLLPLGIFEPYGLAGIGAYITDLDVNVHQGTFHGSTEVTYGFHAGAGFNINFSKSMFAGVEGKYLWAEPSFGGQHIKLDGFVTTALLGYRF